MTFERGGNVVNFNTKKKIRENYGAFYHLKFDLTSLLSLFFNVRREKCHQIKRC